ncbi:MAG TPA: tetratricopeptide repeat protein [Stellaceae bacterium]|nr:tetratricopeptide repeat protein [Stellaceae bacterium]
MDRYIVSRLSGWRRAAIVAAAALALTLGRAPAMAAPAAAPGTAPAAVAAVPQAPVADASQLYGDYLAGRHAQETRDYIAAAQWFQKALAADPKSPELVSRTFLMNVCAGQFDRATVLAPEELKLDPSDAIAELVLVLQKLKAGDAAGAAKEAAALPSDGLHRFVAPFAMAWTRMAAGDLAGADTALQGLDKFNGFQPLKLFQLGILYDYAGDAAKAQQYFAQTLAATPQLNWRLADVIGNFDERHGRAAQAKALYRRFVKESGGSDMGLALAAGHAASPPQPLVRSAADGFAEAMFDLASVLDQPETIDLSLVYDRFALALRPDFPLARLLLADILSAEEKPAESLALLNDIPPTSAYYGPAQLRQAINLATLGRSDEAIALLKQTAAAHPTLIGAELELGDILRDKKDYTEAVAAYDEAIRRTAAAGLPERWSMFYDRGVALERSGQWPRAEGDFLHALKLKPDQPMVLNYLGYSWIDRGENLQRGLKMIEKAVALRPDDGYIIDSLGWAYYRLGDYAQAVKYLEKAIELVPEDPTINDHLGDAYWRTGRLVEARYQWRYALQFGPEKNDIKPIEAKLEHGLAAVARRHGG